jgi:hypothetical protein
LTKGPCALPRLHDAVVSIYQAFCLVEMIIVSHSVAFAVADAAIAQKRRLAVDFFLNHEFSATPLFHCMIGISAIMYTTSYYARSCKCRIRGVLISNCAWTRLTVPLVVWFSPNELNWFSTNARLLRKSQFSLHRFATALLLQCAL